MAAGMYYRVGADFSKLEKLKHDIGDLKNQLKGMDQAANPKEFKRLERQLQQLTAEFNREAQSAAIAAKETEKAGRSARDAASDFDKMVAAGKRLGGAAFFVGMGKELVDIRGKYQQLEIAFTAMLKSGEKASSLMNNLIKFAAETPFGLDSAATGAKQLMAYGSQAENIIDELRMLGDVAAGTGQPLGDLVYLYGTLRTQGKAYLMDIRQFAGRGIPIYEELAKVMKINTDQVNEFVSAGKVGFKEVEQAFQNMTSNGGLYGGLMEEQSKSVLGRIEQLTDNIENLFNKVGKSSEGVIYSIIDTASSAVAHYQEIGEALAALIAVYGTYKTVVIATNAIQQTVNKVRYTAEAAELSKLLTVEQQARISKLNLAKGSAEYADAVKAEILSTNEATQSKLAAARVDLQNLYAKRAEAKEALTLAQAKTAAAREELANAIATAQADMAAKQQKELATLKETAALTRRNAILLQSQSIQAQQAVADAKSVGATSAKIKALQLECNAINNKLATSKAEAMQAQRNVVAKKAEIAAGTQAVTSKRIETLSNKVNTLSEKENAAASTHNALIKQTVGGKILIKKMATDADTLSTNVNTASQTANVTATNFLSLAKTRLAAVATRLNAVIMANPWAWAAAAVIALGYGIYKLITYQTDAEKAQSRLNDAMRESEKGAIGETRELAKLKGELAAAKKDTADYNRIRDEIVSKFGQYNKNLKTEIDTVGLLDSTYQKLTQSIQASFAARQYTKFAQQESDKLDEVISENLGKIQDRLIKKLGDEAAAAKYYSKIRQAIFDGNLSVGTEGNQSYKVKGLDSETQAALDKISGRASNDWVQNFAIEGYIKNILTAQKLTDDFDKKARVKFGIDESSQTTTEAGKIETAFSNIATEVSTATEKVSQLKKELADLRSGKTNSTNYAKDIEDKTKELKDAEEKLATLTGRDKKTISDENSAIKQAKDRKKLTDKQSLQAIRAAEDLEMQINEAEVKAMAEGSEKVLAQLDLNYQKEKQALQRQQEDALKTKKDNARALFEADAHNKGKTFDDTAIQLSEEELNKYNALQKKNDEIYLNDKASLELQYMRDYIKEYGTFQQKKLAIAQEFDKKIAASGNEYDRKSLENQKQAAISAVDFEALNKRIDWQGVFGNLTGMLESQLKETLAGLKEYVKTDQFNASSETDKKTVYDAIENLRKVIPGGEGTINFNAIRQQMSSLAAAIEQLQSATIAEKAAYDTLAKSQKKYDEALKTGNQSIIEGAKQNLDIAKLAATEASNAYKDAETNVQNLGNNLRETSTETIDGLNLVADGLHDLASNSLPQLYKGLQNTITGLSKLNIPGKVGEAIGSFSKALTSAGVIGEIISAVLSILEILKDGIGSFVANIIDTVLNAVDGILKDILSGDIVLKIGNSLKYGISNILNTISFGGFKSLISAINGGNAKETAETISRLTISNEALKVSVDALKDEMAGSNGSKSIQAYNEAVEAQRRYNENLRGILNAQMGYHKAHHSNAYYWNLNSNSLKQVNKLLGTSLKNTWDDFAKLTPEQMNEIRKHLPDIWTEMLRQGKYADRSKDAWNNYADQAGKVDELTTNLHENIAQISFDSLRDSFVETLMDMDKDAKSFTEDFEKYMTKALLNFAIGNILDKDLKKWYTSWADTIDKKNGKLTDDDINNFREQWNDMVQRGLNTRDEIAKLTGYTGKDSSQQAARGVYEGMSQDTGDKLEARNTAIHMTTERMDNKLLTISNDVRNISEQMVYVSEVVKQGIACMEEVRTIQLNSYYELKDINNNTKELYQMNERLGQMNDKLSRL